MMPLHNALESASLGHADGIHKISGRKQGRAHGVTGFHFLAEVAEFLDAFHWCAVEFLDVAEQRLGEALFLLVVETKLDGRVAIRFVRLALQHAVGAGEHNGHRRDDALGVIHARLAELFSK
jgi:hypothetical protein